MSLKFGKVNNNPVVEEATYAPAIEMGVKNTPSQLIVKYITDMYKYPLEAAIRETLSNAIDANTMSGADLSEITTGFDTEKKFVNDSSIHNSLFFVKDSGNGMDFDKLVNVYTQYGVSDKREDADSTGAFGLGAKSPLAYTNDFHVITKTPGGECLYIHCFKTLNGAYLASNPVVVENSIERQSENTNKTYMVNNPFGENEHGTVVLFDASNTHSNDHAAHILFYVNELLQKCDGYSITDISVSGVEGHNFDLINAGSFELTDSTGETATTSVFLNPRELENVFRYLHVGQNDQFSAQEFARCVNFKVGCWVYSPMGESFHIEKNWGGYSCSSSMFEPVVVDIPSRVLPFVPSRDSIRYDNETSVAIEEILVQVRKHLIAFVDNSENLATLYDNLVKYPRYGNFNNSSAAYKLGVFCENLSVKEVTEDEIMFDGMASTLALKDVVISENISFKDLVDSPVCVVGQVHKASDLQNQGVFGIPGNFETYITAVKQNSWKKSVVRSTNRFAKSKKAANDVFADVTTPVLAETTSSRYQNAETINMSIPVGLMFASMASNYGMFNTTAIIDASEIGVSKAVMGVKRIFNNKFGATIEDANYVIIPPKKNEKWTASEKEELIANIETYIEDMFGHSIKPEFAVINAEEVEKLLSQKNKKRNTSTENAEYSKMVRNARWFKLDKTDYSLNSIYSPATKVSQWSTTPQHTAVIVSDHDEYNIVSAALALGIVDDTYTDFICVPQRNFNAKRDEMLHEDGFTVIIDKKGVSNYALLKPAELNCTYNSIQYSGDLDEETRKFFDIKKQEDFVVSLEQKARDLCRSYYGSSSEIKNIGEVLETVTFGYIKLEDCIEKYPTCNITDAQRSFLNFGSSYYKPAIEIGACVSEIDKKRNNAVETFSECVQLWESYLDNFGLHLNGRILDNISYMGTICAEIGIKSAVKAYFEDNIQLEDLIINNN